MHLDFHCQGFIYITLFSKKKNQVLLFKTWENSRRKTTWDSKQTVEKSAKKVKMSNSAGEKKTQLLASVCIIFKINVEVTCKVWVPRRSRSLHNASTASPQAWWTHYHEGPGSPTSLCLISRIIRQPKLCPGTQEIWQKQNIDISTSFFFVLNSNVCLGKTRDEDTVWRVTCIKHERIVRARWAPSAALE